MHDPPPLSFPRRGRQPPHLVCVTHLIRARSQFPLPGCPPSLVVFRHFFPGATLRLTGSPFSERTACLLSSGPPPPGTSAETKSWVGVFFSSSLPVPGVKGSVAQVPFPLETPSPLDLSNAELSVFFTLKRGFSIVSFPSCGVLPGLGAQGTPFRFFLFLGLPLGPRVFTCPVLTMYRKFRPPKILLF